MRKLFRLVLATMLLLAVAGCESNEDIGSHYLEPNYTNIAGIWRLSSWNGAEQTDSPYMYLVLDRGERTIEIYQNLDSGKSRYITGTYRLNKDEDGNITIKGTYDHASGFWAHDYFVTEMSSEKMSWITTDNPNDVSVYMRCDEIPEDILSGTRAL